MLLQLSKDNFDQIVIQSSKPVFVDFWAPWCVPCRVMGPIVEELAGEIDEVEIGKVNVDEHAEIAQRYNILSIPTFIIFKNGQVVEQFSGTMEKTQLRNRLAKYF